MGKHRSQRFVDSAKSHEIVARIHVTAIAKDMHCFCG